MVDKGMAILIPDILEMTRCNLKNIKLLFFVGIDEYSTPSRRMFRCGGSVIRRCLI